MLSNRIYLDVTPEYGKFLKDELTYRVPNYSNPEEPIILKTWGVINERVMTIPIGRIDLIPSGYEIVDKRIYSETEFPDFNGTLRESQQNIWDEVEDNCIINAKVSWGKTFTALAIAGKLGQKALIVTHTVPLRNQWAKQVEKAYGIKPGIIGSNQFNTSGPIVVGNVQTLYGCMDKIGKTFGTVILDEMHHVSAPTFTKVVDKSYARYKVGLSGTIKRKDGKHVVFTDYFGRKIFQPPRENSMTPEVHVINSGIYLPSGPSMGWAARVTMLQESEVYRNLVRALSWKYAAEGHKVLTVSDRVDFLEHCAQLNKGVCVTGRNPDERERLFKDIEAGHYDEIFGTQSIWSEGVSYDPLSCLILGTPVNNEPLLEQLIGRIQRVVPGKRTPVLVDIRLNGHTPEKQFQARLGHYMRQGYEVKYL